MNLTEGEIKLMLLRIEEKLDYLKTEMVDKHKGYDEKFDKVENDINKLKEFQIKAWTLWTVAMSVATLAINKFL